MTSKHHLLQQWDKWLIQSLGNSVLEAEKKIMQGLLSQYYGTQALLIGTPHQSSLLKYSAIHHHVLLSPLLSHMHHKNIASIETNLDELPVASGAIDLVILPHVLEYFDNPQKLLAEACRIVKPQGHIIVIGFNPFSFWGLQKIIKNKQHAPWASNFIMPRSVKKWLMLADFELVSQQSIFYRPPIDNKKMFDKLQAMEWLGRRGIVPFGGIYILIAQAKVIPLTPIKMRWQQKLSGVTTPVIGISGHSRS